MNRKVLIFDTTLRDGEQSPGASLNTAEKIEIARQLELLGVDIIEGGFPITSPGDFEAVQALSKILKKSILCALARAVPKDIESAARALEKARRNRIHVFLATSAIHRKYKLNKAQSEIVKLAVAGVKLARKYSDDVEFSPEDASRTEPEFLQEVEDRRYRPFSLEDDVAVRGDDAGDVAEKSAAGDVGHGLDDLLDLVLFQQAQD